MERVDAEEKMEDMVSSDPKNNTTQQPSRRLGGLRTMPFIIVNESFEKVASYGIMPNMILYFMGVYGMELAKGSSTLSLFSALSNTTPVLGAFLSDSYFGRFAVIAAGSIFSLLGVIVLWLTSVIPQAQPQRGESASSGQLCFLYSVFVFLAIGAGGIRPCSIAFGADQLDRKENPNNQRVLESYFNWYYASIGVATMIAFTVIVYIQDNFGWKIGFGIPAIIMFFSVLMFFLGSPLYVKVKADKCLFTGLAQVMVATFKNRSLAYPADGRSHYSKDSKLVSPSKRLGFLNKACVIRDAEKDLKQDGSASNPWKLCTVDQVEGFKALIRILPIWSTGIIIYMTISHGTAIIQAKTMNRHLTSNFQIPAGSFTLFTVLTLTIWVAFYDRVIVPFLSKYTGRSRGISNKLRMGIGLVLSILAMVVAGLVENVRRRRAIREGFLENPRAVMGMSAMWLVPQFCISGLAEGFNAIGQIEFYYSQLPKNMASLAMALFSLGNAFSGLLSSLLINIVDKVTTKDGKVSWIASNPNKGHYDYYYWLTAVLGAANLLYFLICCWVYGPSGEKETGIFKNLQEVAEDDRESPNKEELPNGTFHG